MAGDKGYSLSRWKYPGGKDLIIAKRTVSCKVDLKKLTVITIKTSLVKGLHSPV